MRGVLTQIAQILALAAVMVSTHAIYVLLLSLALGVLSLVVGESIGHAAELGWWGVVVVAIMVGGIIAVLISRRFRGMIRDVWLQMSRGL